MAYSDGYYYGQCKIVAVVDNAADDGKTVLITTTDNKTYSGTIVHKRCEFLLPPRTLCIVQKVSDGSVEFTTEVEAGYGDCILVHLDTGYVEVKQRDIVGLDYIKAATADDLKNKVPEANAIKVLNSSLSDNTTGESFNYGVKDGVRGFFTNPSRADDSFIPFSSKEQFTAELLDALRYSEFELNASMTWEDIMNYFKTLYPDHYTLVSRTQNINLLGSCSTKTNYDVTSISGGFDTTSGLYFTSTSKGGGYQNQSHGFCFNSPFDVTKYKSMTVKITTWAGGATGLGLRNVHTPNYGSNVVATIPSGVGTKTIDISSLSGNMYLGLSADVGCTVYIDSIELYP